jgi:tRNA dimethylallyltransferase
MPGKKLPLKNNDLAHQTVKNFQTAKMADKPKILIIVGPTSSGKSELAVKLAKGFSGEIISCDSRQVYRNLDIGTGKVLGKWTSLKKNRRKTKEYIYREIRHHLIDFVSPKKQYSAALFKLQANKAINEILRRGKLPILCGGTGHWIDSVVFDQDFPEVPPNLKLRLSLEKLSADILFHKLIKLDPKRANTIDRNNKRRLIRALEIVITTGRPISPQKTSISQPKYEGLWLGIRYPQEILYKKIDRRLSKRLKSGMITEVQMLHRGGLSWTRLESFGLEYKFISLYLQKKLPYDKMASQLSYAIKHFSKRQMTWWKKNSRIQWLKSPDKAFSAVQKILKNNKPSPI